MRGKMTAPFFKRSNTLETVMFITRHLISCYSFSSQRNVRIEWHSGLSMDDAIKQSERLWRSKTTSKHRNMLRPLS